MSRDLKRQSALLGTHDLFKNGVVWDEVTAQRMVDVLDQRSASLDQVKLRERIIELSGVGPGDSVVEIGCGTGALLCDLARSVGPGGRVIGTDVQPAFVQAAIERLSKAGYASISEVKSESAEKLSLGSESANVCFAQTTLVHLPEKILRQALLEMVRVVRKGGKVISVDQDGDTWIIDHPNRDLTRRIVAFNCDHRYADGWTGRRLRRFFREAGLCDAAVYPWTHMDVEAESYLFAMATRLAKAAAEAGVILMTEHDEWMQQLYATASAGNFFSSINFYTCVGTRANQNGKRSHYVGLYG